MRTWQSTGCRASPARWATAAGPPQRCAGDASGGSPRRGATGGGARTRRLESICFVGGEIKGAFNVSSEGRGGEQWRSARWRLCSVRGMDSLGGSEPATRRGGWWRWITTTSGNWLSQAVDSVTGPWSSVVNEGDEKPRNLLYYNLIIAASISS